MVLDQIKKWKWKSVASTKKNLCVSCSDGVKNRKSQALGANEIFGEVQSVSEAESFYKSLAVSYSYETELEI